MHNSSTNETDYSSYDTLDLYKLYGYSIKIRYYIRTTNNLINPDGNEYSVDSEIMPPLKPQLPRPSYDLEGEFDFDNGKVLIYTPNALRYYEKKFLIRYNELTGEKDIIYNYNFITESGFFRDFTVEQGITYLY